MATFYVQLEDRLLQISGELTADNISNALGYTPSSFSGEFEDLQKVEDRFMQGPYIHHFIEIEGDYRKEINEFCKYVPNLSVDRTLEK